MKAIILSVGLMLACVVVLVLAQIGGSKQDSAIAANLSQPTPAAIAVPENNTLIASNTMSDANAVTTPSGLKYIELKEGTGATPQTGQKVVVHYT